MIDYNKVSLANQVFEKLERMILYGVYPQSSILEPSQLALDLSVGISTIKEAVAKLEVEKLIAQTPEGYKVLGITTEDIEDMFKVKKEIEVIAAGRVAERISPEAVEQLRIALEEQEKSIDSGDSEKARNFDTKFHDILYSECGSKTFEMILSPIHHKLAKYRMISLKNSERGEYSVKEHREVFEAIAAGNRKLVEKLMLTHIENAYKSIISATERK